MRGGLNYLRIVLVFTVTTAVYLSALVYLQPTSHSVYYSKVIESKSEHKTKYVEIDDIFTTSEPPFKFRVRKSKAEVSFTMDLKKIHPTKFGFIFNRCLNRLSVNGSVIVEDSNICRYPQIHAIDLKGIVKTGPNKVVAVVETFNEVGAVHVYPYYLDNLLAILHLVFLVFIGVMNNLKSPCTVGCRVIGMTFIMLGSSVSGTLMVLIASP